MSRGEVTMPVTDWLKHWASSPETRNLLRKNTMSQIPEDSENLRRYHVGLFTLVALFGFPFVLACLVAPIGFIYWYQHKFDENPFVFKSNKYVVPTRNIAEGDILSAADLKIVELKMSHVLGESPETINQVIGRRAAHAIPADQPIIEYHLCEQPTATEPAKVDR